MMAMLKQQVNDDSNGAPLTSSDTGSKKSATGASPMNVLSSVMDVTPTTDCGKIPGSSCFLSGMASTIEPPKDTIKSGAMNDTGSMQRRRRLTVLMATTSSLMVYSLMILLATAARPCEAWIPPHPSANITWESVHDMRQRLGIVFDYSPKLIHPEICRHLSEEECQTVDEGLIDHGRRHRALATRQNPNLGTFKVLVLLVVFKDHADRPLIDMSDVELLWNTIVPEWFDAVSHGKYNVEPYVAPWVVTDNTEDYYAFQAEGVVPEFQKAAWPALDALDNTPGWDWADFDKDQDGKLDSVVITHSGYGAETATNDEYGRPYTKRIWAHAFSGSGLKQPWTSKDGSVSLSGYTVTSAFEGDKGVKPQKMGLTVHEYMHTFNIEDLYDLTDPYTGYGIGSWDIMASPYGPAGDANMPGHLSTWAAMEADWVEPEVITADGVYTLRPLETSPDAYQIIFGGEGDKLEYLLLENRQRLEFDLDLPGTGLAIYHVDMAVDLQKFKGYPGQVVKGKAWPENGLHYMVAMVQADTEYELEKGEDKGDPTDLWKPGMTLTPGSAGGSKTIYPNTDRYQGGVVEETGITITVLEPDDELGVKFEVSGLKAAQATTTTQPTGETDAPTQLPTVSSNTDQPTIGETEATAKPSLNNNIFTGEGDGTTTDVVPTSNPAIVGSEYPSIEPSFAPTESPAPTASMHPSLATSVSPRPSSSMRPSFAPSFMSLNSTDGNTTKWNSTDGNVTVVGGNETNSSLPLAIYLANSTAPPLLINTAIDLSSQNDNYTNSSFNLWPQLSAGSDSAAAADTKPEQEGKPVPVPTSSAQTPFTSGWSAACLYFIAVTLNFG